jgi:hypothetical protein
VRRRRLGFPDEPLVVAHRPVSWWLALFRLSHREAGGVWERIAWPDGGPLWQQSWPLAAAFELMRDEHQALAAEQARRVSPAEIRKVGSR